jgi:hypothetical protein
MLFGKHMQGSFSYMARLRGELDMNYAYEADNLSYGKKSMKKSNESKNFGGPKILTFLKNKMMTTLKSCIKKAGASHHLLKAMTVFGVLRVHFRAKVC